MHAIRLPTRQPHSTEPILVELDVGGAPVDLTGGELLVRIVDATDYHAIVEGDVVADVDSQGRAAYYPMASSLDEDGDMLVYFTFLPATGERKKWAPFLLRVAPAGGG